MNKLSTFLDVDFQVNIQASGVRVLDREEGGMRNFYHIDFRNWSTHSGLIDLTKQYN